MTLPAGASGATVISWPSTFLLISSRHPRLDLVLVLLGRERLVRDLLDDLLREPDLGRLELGQLGHRHLGSTA